MRVFGVVVVAFLVLLVGATFSLPDTWRVSRSLRIDAAPAVLRPYVTNLAAWPEWLPWGPAQDKSLQRSFDGTGVGARMTWKGDETGEGVLTLKSVGDDGVTYTQVVGGGRYTNEGAVRLVPDGAATLVTWTEHGRIDNPLLRWFGTSFEQANGGDYERGLLNLQKLVTGKSQRPQPGATGTEPAAPVPDAPPPPAPDAGSP